ncbi:hypothetical protein, conserved [Eimeria brunetti]|uniref:Uncharacterized protein n=1 Tax=Eimeria brunetti TaxID=51314 RepID=U6LPX5_9EIME|nr:hypothetical protein, conserved [Eimeria brunetti]
MMGNSACNSVFLCFFLFLLLNSKERILFSVEAAAAEVALETPQAAYTPQGVSAAPGFGKAAPADEGVYLLRRENGPSIKLKVVDENGHQTEVPIAFHEMRIEPRGFWGDVAVNGMALFFASACILLFKEFLSFAAARKQRKQEATARAAAAQRRAAIIVQLEEADQQLQEIKEEMKKAEENKEKNKYQANNTTHKTHIRHILQQLDAYRHELKTADAPAVTAYAESLILTASQLLRSRSKQQHEQQQQQQQQQTNAAAETDAAETDAVDAAADAAAAAAAAAGSKTIDEEEEENMPFRSSRRQQQQQQQQQQDSKPDIETVQMLMQQNPHLNPTEIIKMAAEIKKREMKK